MDIKELYWAAGFLEGEGYFSCGGERRTSATIAASQVNLEPLLRLQKVLGGKIDGPYKSQHQKGNPFVRWRAGSVRAVGCMMTLYTLMSEKRRQAIRKAIRTWRAAPGAAITWMRSGVCQRGHPLSGENYIVAPSGHGRCRQCGIESRRRYYEQHKDKWPNYVAKRKAAQLLEVKVS